MKKILFLSLLTTFAYFGSACLGIEFQQDSLGAWIFNPYLMNENKNFIFSMSHFIFNDKDAGKNIDNAKNIEEWVNESKFKGDKREIDMILNHVSPEEFAVKVNAEEENHINQNNFILHLKKTGQIKLSEYLFFAKSIENFNTIGGFSRWETDDDADAEKRKKVLASLKKAEKLYEKADSEFLKTRFAFLLIRLAYYIEDESKVKAYFEKYLSDKPSSSIIYFWALSFRALVEPERAKKNYLLSLVFSKSAEKKPLCFYKFSNDEIDSTLLLARNNEEKSWIYAMKHWQFIGRSLPELKNIQRLSPDGEALRALMVREINKVEKWVCEPRYFYLIKNTDAQIFNKNNFWTENAYQNILKNYQKDLQYLAELKDFSQKCLQESSSQNKDFWLVSTSCLAFLSDDFKKAEKYAQTVLNNKQAEKKIILQATILRTLARLYVCKNEQEREILLMNDIQAWRKNAPDEYFYRRSVNKIFVILAEYYRQKGNFLKEMLCFANLVDISEQVDFNDEKFAYEHVQMPNSSAFYTKGYRINDYIFLLDSRATTENTAKFVAYASKKDKSDVEKFWAGKTPGQINRLWDLLGMKYLRENRLKEARNAFSKVENSFWQDENEPFLSYLDANPFYVNSSSTLHQKSVADTVRFNKLQITDSLITLLRKAEDKSLKNRSKYYILAGNVYLNMTYHGNSWLMMRYLNSITEPGPEEEFNKIFMPDFEEYYGCTRAKEMYEKALRNTNDKSVRALALLLMVQCDFFGSLHKGTQKNLRPYFNIFNKEYPEHAQKMIQCSAIPIFWEDVMQ